MSNPPAKRRRISPPVSTKSAKSSSKNSELPIRKGSRTSASTSAKWDAEQDYEQRPRKIQGNRNESKRLPIKTSEGWVEQAAEEEPIEEDADSFLASDDGERDQDDAEEELEEEEETPKISPRQQILEAKEELAKIAGLVNEDPEEHIGGVRTLAQFASSSNLTVRKLALVTQLAVYKDVIPGYRIRPLSEEEKSAKISKDVRKIRSFEQTLVSGYQDYVQTLSTLTKESGRSKSEEEASLVNIAFHCASTLLTSVPHFNFRGELLQIMVRKLSTRNVNDNFVKCRQALETLFRDDEEGNASLDAVTTLTKMMKSRNYKVDESVLNTFLHLRLLSELSVKGSYNSIDKPEEETAGKLKKKHREFRTKKERKIVKERKKISQEMKEADAEVSHEERDRIQSETLKLVFVAYFRILKAREPSLMGAVLEGLAKYSHLINQDFFGDILEALKDLINATEASQEEDEDEDEADSDDEDDTTTRSITRQSLLCVITAFALLEGQDAHAAAHSLHLDLNFFITHLYRTLHPVSLNPDIEFSAKSLRLPDPNSSDGQSAMPNRVNVQTTTVLLLRSLSSVLIPPKAFRAVPPVRIAAFTKQLLTASLHLPEKSLQAMLALLQKVAKVQGKKIAALWNTEERRGDGNFDALRPEVEGSNPFATTIWEGELLRMHYCPYIKDAVVDLEKTVHKAR